MFKFILSLFLIGLFLASSSVQADPKIQVFKLFDEQLVISTGPVFPDDPVVRDSTSVEVVRGAQDMVIISSSPDGSGIPNMDDFLTINGEFVQSGWYLPLFVEAMTGTYPEIPGCILGISVNVCSLPHPHFHPVDVSNVIPTGLSMVTAELWDFGGGYGHTEIYLIIIPKPFQ
jgi:hypothetical protein